jgi:muramoyltetrapeptide carboxypeptidase
MIIPKFLTPGDRIGIVAPARKVSKDEMTFAFNKIREWGFEPVTGRHFYGEQNQFSGSDRDRTEDINAFLEDSSIRAIVSARGGYGCMRIVDLINWDNLRNDPKWIAGYSDITVFHNHLINLGVASIHGTMPINFHKNDEATASLRNILTGTKSSFEIDHHTLNKHGKVKGQVIGGNLSLMYGLQGSISFPDTKGKILFLEDLDEYLYHVDRMMQSLKRSGSLKDLAGLVVGGMSEMKDNTVPFGQTAEEIIHDAVKDYGYPVCFNFPAGHIDRNLSFIMGAEAELNVTFQSATLTF